MDQIIITNFPDTETLKKRMVLSLYRNMKIASVVGARPNFIKLAPIHRAISSISEHMIIHTGQHYDFEMSEIFFKEFHLPEPDFNLGIGSGTQGFQIGEMIKEMNSVLLYISSTGRTIQ